MKPSFATWFNCQKTGAPPAVRLFCFPYAGGGAAIYRSWGGILPKPVEVCAAQLPGRGTRMREPAVSDLGALVRALADALENDLDRPFAFFGHSMGALICFELARHLRERGAPQPVHLFVSGRRAPQLPSTQRVIHDLPEPEFVEELRRLQGTPPEVLEHPELMQLLSPLLRADFSLAETYAYAPGPPLDCPVSAFGGLQDEEVGREELEGWKEQTTGRFKLRMMPGNHFFLDEGRQPLLRSIAEDISPFIS
ncbi:MAG TPA: thioesterase II family protein [Pyrinomonadaceae bacterium]|jgi:medium-chain acyl-[acyl-carrier-protein] hydrolase